jgi:hypothetical protein
VRPMLDTEYGAATHAHSASLAEFFNGPLITYRPEAWCLGGRRDLEVQGGLEDGADAARDLPQGGPLQASLDHAR